MANVEKISIALPPKMVAVVRQAVETGEYASSSEVVRDALRDWTQKRSLRQQGIDELRARCGGKRWKTKRPVFRSMRHWPVSNASTRL
jgi:putative addiction module CopG family antidote